MYINFDKPNKADVIVVDGKIFQMNIDSLGSVGNSTATEQLLKICAPVYDFYLLINHKVNIHLDGSKCIYHM